MAGYHGVESVGWLEFIIRGAFIPETWERRSKGGSLARVAPSIIWHVTILTIIKKDQGIILTTAACAQSLEFIRGRQGQLPVCKCYFAGCLIRLLKFSGKIRHTPINGRWLWVKILSYSWLPDMERSVNILKTKTNISFLKWHMAELDPHLRDRLSTLLTATYFS